MEQMTLFINSFLSYLLLVLVIVVLGAIAVTIGITLRKRKNAQSVDMAEATEGSAAVKETN